MLSSSASMSKSALSKGRASPAFSGRVIQPLVVYVLFVAQVSFAQHTVVLANRRASRGAALAGDLLYPLRGPGL